MMRAERADKAPLVNKYKNALCNMLLYSALCLMAEREGFEPSVPFGTAVFKTAAIDHSATSPAENASA